MRVLGIETTCDETAAAVVRLAPGGGGEILSNEVMSQIAEHAAYGGVVPEIAARAHIEVLDRLILRALEHAGVRLADLDGVAAAAGPGLIGGVIVGLTMAKALALASRKPYRGQSSRSARADRAAHRRDFLPYLLLLVSGGHTQLVARARASATTCGSARPSTTPSAKPSTRSRNCSACPIPAARRSRSRALKATRRASIFRGRCSAGRNPISPSPASRRR